MASESVDPEGIVPVSIVPEYCGQCGAALERRPFEGTELPWCPDCRYLFSKNPVPGVQVLVHGEETVLLVSEPHVEGTLWNVPGGHAAPGEGPKEAGLRELAEETGVTADPAALSLFDVHHGDFPRLDYYMITYAVERAAATGEPDAAGEVEDAAYWPVERMLDSSDVTRPSEREQVRRLFELD